MGNDPEASGSQPDFTLGLEGPGHTKINGDRFQPKACGSSSVSYCTTSASIENDEFDEDGYFFAVEVDAVHGQDLVFEVFDPAYVAVGAEYCSGSPCVSFNRSCTNVQPKSSERSALEALTSGSDYTSGSGDIPEDWYDDVDTRFQSGVSVWCVADGSGGENPVDTSVIVREPDDTPWNPLDNAPIVQRGCEPASFDGHYVDYNLSGGYSTSIPELYDLLDPTNPTFNSQGEWAVDLEDNVWTLAETYRRWTTVCRIPGAFVETGKYLIQVRSTGSVINPLAYDAAEDGAGLNSYMLRAGYDTGSGIVTYGDVNVYAEGHLPIAANSNSANPRFHLARVLEVGRDRTLTVELFDAGDAGSSGYIQVLTSNDVKIGGAHVPYFSGCTFDLEGTGSPAGANPSQCKVTGVSSTAGYNGKVMLIQVPIPDSYECDETDPEGCWAILEMGFSDVHDFTTWSAYISGDPVRLIE